METLIAVLKNALGLTVRQGWIFLLFGVFMILLTQSGIAPASDTWDKWTPIFAVVATLGACILAVSMASWIMKRVNDARYEGSTREASNRKWEAALEAGVRNLDVLNETETAYLVWILRRGQRRFRADFPSYTGNNLGPKKIIFNGDEHALDIYQVNPKIWEMREQLISRFSQIRDSQKAPWDREF